MFSIHFLKTNQNLNNLKVLSISLEKNDLFDLQNFGTNFLK